MRKVLAPGELPYQFFLVHHENGSVGLKIDSLGALDYFKALDCDVFFVGEAEAYEVEHYCLFYVEVGRQG
jgi:hypothetical protein